MAHYKKREIADDSLASLFNTAYPSFEVIFVDNASNDGTCEFLKRKYPRLKILVNACNVGSGGAWNAGFRIIDPESKYVVFVDCDVIFDSNWLSKLVEVAEENPNIGGLQPKILSFWEPTMFEYNGSAGMWMDVYGYALNRGRIFYILEEDTGQYDMACETFFVGGSVFFARSDTLRHVGLFDESFFIYHEELDLAWRILLYGYKLFCVPSSKVWHKGGAKKDKTTMFRKYKNNIYMLIKNYELKNICLYLPLRFVLDIVSIAKNSVTPIFAYWWILKNFRLIWTHRLGVQVYVRRVSDNELMYLLIKQPSPILHYFLGYRRWRDFVAINPNIFHPLKDNRV